jgi:hypothetical protein
MNAYQLVLQLARKSLIWLGVLVVLCVAVVWGLGELASNLKNQLAQQQSALQEQQALLQAKQTDLSNMREHIERYQALRNQGLVGEPDRALWVEQLQNSHQKLQLPGGLAVQLQAAKFLAPKPAGIEPDPTQPEPMVHDLQFEIRNAVETDVLRLIREFRAQATGRFRVNACKVLEPKGDGFIAQCVLRFVTVPVGVAPGPEPAAPPPPG